MTTAPNTLRSLRTNGRNGRTGSNVPTDPSATNGPTGMNVPTGTNGSTGTNGPSVPTADRTLPATPSRLVAQARISTPLGALTLAATARGLALAWFDNQAHRTDDVDAPVQPGHPHLQQAAREFSAYFAGHSRVFAVPLDALGTPFQQRVWQALLAIAPGQLSTYGAIARQLGRPDAARAVGAAVGRNPIGIIVPCHRVVGSNGALTGYAAGLARKQALLALEGARTASLFAAA